MFSRVFIDIFPRGKGYRWRLRHFALFVFSRSSLGAWGTVFELFWVPLGVTLGASWAPWELFGHPWELLWAHFAGPWAPLAMTWVHFGSIFDDFGFLVGSRGSLLHAVGRCGAIFYDCLHKLCIILSFLSAFILNPSQDRAKRCGARPF